MITQKVFLKLILSLIILKQVYNEYVNSIPFCEKTHILTTEDSQPFNPNIICIQCKQLKVLSSDFQKCLDVRQEIRFISLGNCLRLGEDGYCAEALPAIEMNGTKFSYNEEIMFNERCAKIDLGYNRCLYPRFGYTLDISSNLLHQDSSYFHSYCAIYDSRINSCLEYFPGFLPHPNQGLGRFLQNFINKDKIDYSRSNSQMIFCKKGYLFIGTIEQPAGCVPITRRVKTKGSIINCEEHEFDNILCKKCKTGFAINKNRLSCKNILVDKCIEFQMILGEAICSKCEDFYRYRNGICIEMNNCKQVNKYTSDYCIACQTPYTVQFDSESCQIMKEISNDKCDQFSNNNQCYLCKDNNLYYLNHNECTKRILSKYCKYPDPNSDTCQTLECIDESYFISVDDMFVDVDLSHPSLFTVLQEEKNKIKQDLSIKVHCLQRTQYPIEGCSKHHKFFDSCELCQSNYFLRNKQQSENNESTQRKYHYNNYQYGCSQNDPQYTQINIENCILYSGDKQSCLQCQEGYYESNTKCIKGIENCAFHYDSNNCARCKQQYINFGKLNKKDAYVESHCIKNEKLIGLIPHIAIDDLQLNRKKIEFNKNQCISFNQDRSCEECAEGQTLTQDNKCISDALLPYCKKGNFISKDIYACQSCTSSASLIKDKCQLIKKYSCFDKLCPQKCNSLFKMKQKKSATKNPLGNNTSTRGGSTGGTKTRGSSVGGSKGNITKNPNEQNTNINEKNQKSELEQCLVNIDDNYFINERPKFNKSFLGQLEIKKCTFENCLRCDIDGCQKCDKSFGLDFNIKQCRRLCEGKLTDDKYCIQPQFSEVQEANNNDDQDDLIILEEEENSKKEQTDRIQDSNTIVNDQTSASLSIILILTSLAVILLIVFFVIRFYRRRKIISQYSSQISSESNRIDITNVYDQSVHSEI